MHKLVTLVLIIVISFSLSGCLVQDDSSSMSIENEREKKMSAKDMTQDFFNYNQVDTTSDDINYDAERLINLFKEKDTGSSVTIDPIIGSKYDKSYQKLKEELETQETLFNAQQEYNYKLLFKNPDGEKSYKTLVEQGKFTNYTATYDALFQVFEELEGTRVLTDNGIITFELEYQGNKEWLINHVTIDYRDLGSITIE